MTELRIGSDFALPLEVVTEASAIVATRGAGKSSTSVVLVEEAHGLGVQSVILDRTGVYHGIRSSRKGDGAGLPFYVLGGPHGDVPLEPNAGALIADLVVDTGHSFVLDLSDLSKANAIRFSGSFMERLYDRKARARTTLLLVVDEAHFYAPQTPRGGFKGESATLMGAMEDIVGLGRSRGLGVVLTTQRTQALNKAVLDLIETLFVMRMLSPRAREAVRLWIAEKNEEDRTGVIASLDSLPTGTAWVWSPLRGVLEKVQVRRIKTFDSYSTPAPGQARLEPTARKELDLGALGEQMRATVERAKQTDPKELRKRIRELEKQLVDQAAETVTETVEVEKIVEVPVLNGQAETLEQAVSALHGIAGTLAKAAEMVSGSGAEIIGALERFQKPAPAPAPAARPRVAPGPRQRAAVPVEPLEAGDVRLGKGERTVLEILAEYPGGRTHNELAFLAGYSAKASTLGVILANLRRAGLVEPGQPIRPTQAGLDTVGGVRERPTGDALLQQWLRHPRMGEGERRVLLALIDLDYEPPHVELCEMTGYSPTASTMGVILSKLRKLGLVENGHRRLAPEFREAIGR